MSEVRGVGWKLAAQAAADCMQSTASKQCMNVYCSQAALRSSSWNVLLRSIEIGPCPVYVPYAYSTAEPARAMSGLSVSAVTLWGNLLIPIEVHGSRLGTGWHACTLTRVVSAQLILLSAHLVLKHQCMPKADSSRRNVS